MPRVGGAFVRTGTVRCAGGQAAMGRLAVDTGLRCLILREAALGLRSVTLPLV
jgi:hypothetical protein